MPTNYGLSFQPGQDNGDQTGRQTPAQQAIKLLSLRLPSVVGARAISPQALLEGSGSAGIGGPGGMAGESLITWLKKLLQQSQAAAPPQADSAFGAPSPATMAQAQASGHDVRAQEDRGGQASLPSSQPRMSQPTGGFQPSQPAPSIPTPIVRPGEDERIGGGRVPEPPPQAPSAPAENPWDFRNPFDVQGGYDF